MEVNINPWKRILKSGKSVYYVDFINVVTGEKIKTISSKKTNKSAARRWAIDYLQSGKLDMPEEKTFRAYSEKWFHL